MQTKKSKLLLDERFPSTLREGLLNRVSAFASSLPPSAAATVLSKTLFKKLQSDKRDPALAAKAQSTFLRTEIDCAQTNRRIRECARSYKDYSASNILYAAKRKIQRILGPFNIETMLSLGRFGPGSTYGARGVDVSMARKFSLTDVTPEFNNIARGLLAEYPTWSRFLADADFDVCPILGPIIPGGRYSTVPKDQSTDRSIIVEPTVNSFFQQAIGRYMRRKLLFATVDLNDQTTNQRLAQLGSITNDLATVDLSSASDLISYEVVKDLLPEDWFFWLDITRSHRVQIDGNWVKLEKFSSMGNGFTFDLQSLIFYSICTAICDALGFNSFWTNVFGDDIIIPSGCKELLFRVFSDLGFQVNEEKSFFEGPFRESCGADYYCGQNVRGVYIKRLFTHMDALKLHNRLFAWSDRTGIDTSELRRFIRRGNKFQHYLVPARLGDVGFHSVFDECRPPIARNGWEGYRFRSLKPVLLKHERDDRFLLLARLFQGNTEFQRNTVALRNEAIGYVTQEVVSDF